MPNEQNKSEQSSKVINGVKLLKLRMNGCACCNCGWPLDPDDFIAVCSDCGGIFCEGCVSDGSFASHECDNGDDGYDD